MDKIDTKNKSVAELQEHLDEKRTELRRLYFQDREKQLKNVRSIRKTRAEIARIQTAMNAPRSS